jgi:2-polyprenyl-3-methyl-5-hydroxy-6-metoxy-1,4-benzoquinol methylase
MKNIKHSWTSIKRHYNRLSLLNKIHVFIRYKTLPLKVFALEENVKGNLLDFGCGHGLVLANYINSNPELILFGIEHDEMKVQIVMDCLPKVNILNVDELQGNYHNFFDYVIISDVLYCNDNKQQREILQLLKQSMKPDGILIMKETVSTPRIKYFISTLQEILAVKIFTITKGTVINLPSINYYLKLLSESGFINIKNSPAHYGYLYPHHLFTCRKN